MNGGTYDVRIMPEASQLLAEHACWWIENRSRDEALRWYEAFVSALKGLSQFPESHPLAPESEDSLEIRNLLFGLGSRPTHRAVFRIKGRVVEVLTIRHHSQDDIRKL